MRRRLLECMHLGIGSVVVRPRQVCPVEPHARDADIGRPLHIMPEVIAHHHSLPRQAAAQMCIRDRHYFDNFVKFWTDVQENDWAVDGAMTDVKGDRSLSPSKQADPDLFLHVVERTADGVYVTGAKAHQTGYINSHYVLVMPTISMREGDEDYAISFACPTDAEGITPVSYTHLSTPAPSTSGGSSCSPRPIRPPDGRCV